MAMKKKPTTGMKDILPNIIFRENIGVNVGE